MLDPDSLEQLVEWERAAALAEAAAGEDETAWELCGPGEDEGHECSDFGPEDPHTDPSQAEMFPEEALAALSWEDLYENPR